MLQCFSRNTDLLAFSVSDPKTELLTAEEIAAVPMEYIPPNLRFLVWRSQTFRVRRVQKTTASGAETSTIDAERGYHPRNFRGSRYLRDWHEEMVFDHLAGDYERQLTQY